MLSQKAFDLIEMRARFIEVLFQSLLQPVVTCGIVHSWQCIDKLPFDRAGLLQFLQVHFTEVADIHFVTLFGRSGGFVRGARSCRQSTAAGAAGHGHAMAMRPNQKNSRMSTTAKAAPTAG